MSQTFHLLKPRQEPRLLSLVIPVYNEHEVFKMLRQELEELLAMIACPTEIILVNDGSADDTLAMALQWAQADSRIRVLGLSRNFGHQAAVTAGLDVAAGDAIVVMDADLQDPPNVVLEMLQKYREGYDVVYGQRIDRTGESSFKRFTAWAFYRFMRTFIHKDLPADTGDFRLVSRQVLIALNEMRETHRFLRGMVAWAGFSQTAVQFKRPPRAAGSTKYPLRKMIRFAWTAACSFSAAPLRVSLFFGIAVALFGFVAAFWAILTKWFGYTERGWTSLMAVICVVGGAILFSIGVLGEYIGRIFEEVKGRPLYLVSTRANFGPEFERSPEQRMAEAERLARKLQTNISANPNPSAEHDRIVNLKRHLQNEQHQDNSAPT
ncbi:MAG TPA: glycosyltransferase family 2 protein [Tepidisphaeraceae bacterium]|nr:glycosyltransferase family 2 protein [Tepidisphaeraceae bacterium]